MVCHLKKQCIHALKMGKDRAREQTGEIELETRQAQLFMQCAPVVTDITVRAGSELFTVTYRTLISEYNTTMS